ITAQILNFGLPAPIDIRFEGSDVRSSQQLAIRMLAQLRSVRGLADLRIHQPFDYPTLNVDVERTKASQAGYTERDVTNSVLNTLSGSFQITPMFFLNWDNAVNYNMAAQTPQYSVDSLAALENIPINRSGAGPVSNLAQGSEGSEAARPTEILGDL